MNQIDLSDFLQKHQLDRQFSAQAEEYFLPLARELVNLHQNKHTPILVGINGAQGSGKSTLSDLLVDIFEKKYRLNAVSLSLDDFYYTRKERKQLSETVHPLFLTRGVPGTHDIALANETLNALMHHDNAQAVLIPRFNKAEDDRHPTDKWSKVSEAPDIVIFEGWCVGATAQEDIDLEQTVNSLESQEDSHGLWRQHVNKQLKQDYSELFSRFDCTAMLKAPSFECVYNWRLEQEQKLIATLDESEHSRTMNPKAIERFIQHYQRITEHVLKTLPNTAEYVFELNEKRQIIQRKKQAGFNPLSASALVVTDLDGSLLDHYTYSFADAQSTMDYLEQNAVPVIPCSSKTQAEIEALRIELNNQHPFIVENGAAVFIPKGYLPVQPDDTVKIGHYWVKQFVQPHEHWLRVLETTKQNFGHLFTSFSQMSTKEIADVTGLALEQAALAAQRQFGEPILWRGNEIEKTAFIHAVEAQGAKILQGGRFLHICGDANKGNALIWLNTTFQMQHKKEYTSIAIGDSHNDVQMLDMADYALVIRSPVHDVPLLSRVDHIHIPDGFGPIGWAKGIHQILDDLLDLEISPVTGEHHG